MPSRSSGPGRNPVAISLCLVLACVAVAVLCAATARAADYKMLLCAANNGGGSFATATNTTSPQNPGGIFGLENYCRPAPDPAGNAALLRIYENQPGGNAGYGAYGSFSWTAPPWIAILTGGGYTRDAPINVGWRARFWAEGFDGSVNNILMQGAGVGNGTLGGIGWDPTSTFASHLWPFSGLGYYRRFVFEMACLRPAGCDRSGWNGVDANTFTFTLADVSPVQLQLTNTGAPFLGGAWVKGNQTATYSWSDQGSGIRMEWIDIDGARQWTADHASECDIGYSGVNGVFARSFQPCATASNVGRADAVNTATLPDGAHTLQACAQDFAQWQGLDGTGGASCQSATIRTDNTPPGAPSGLNVVSSNPARYLDRFGARFGLPPNFGSPIAKVHYYVTDAAGKVVVPEHVVAVTNPTALTGIEGPAKAGAYTLHVALEDQVGFRGPFASAAIPRDTTPPAAPQNLHVIGTTAHRAPTFDVQWSNVVDDGSPIDAAHYQVIDASGNVVGATRTVTGANVESITGIESPSAAGDYRVRVWLSDAEGNVGAAAVIAVPRDMTPPAAPQNLHVIGTTAHRVPRFDVQWSNVVDDGSPIDAAHYQVIDASGNVVGATRTVTGANVESIAGIETPPSPGDYRERVWLTDGEGNTGAAAVVPVPRDTTPPSAPQNVSVASASTSRAEQGFDVRWHNITDDGSPIAAAHYRVLDASGNTVVPETTVTANNIEGIADLATPRQRGNYTLVLWLSDGEGNVGAPVRVPLSYECVQSERGGGSTLTAGLGRRDRPQLLVQQREGAVLAGRLRGQGGGTANAPVCVFSRVVTEGERRFLGLAMTGKNGRYEFAVRKGPSRELAVAYRPDQREVTARAMLHVRVHPTLNLRSTVVHNGHFAIFRGTIPSGRKKNVLIVIQVKSGNGWRVFRRLVIHRGRYVLRYRFTRTTAPTTYIMRAQVQDQSGYPYEGGNSRVLRLHVLP